MKWRGPPRRADTVSEVIDTFGVSWRVRRSRKMPRATRQRRSSSAVLAVLLETPSPRPPRVIVLAPAPARGAARTRVTLCARGDARASSRAHARRSRSPPVRRSGFHFPLRPLAPLTKMQHPRGVSGLHPGVTAWTRDAILSLPRDEQRALTALVDEAGVRSARAQQLPNAITSVVRPRAPSRLPFVLLVRDARCLTQTRSLRHASTPFIRPPRLTRHPPPLDRSQDRLTHEQRLYLFCDASTSPRGGPSVLLGILKVGCKNLFVTRFDDDRVVEIEPCCVLDFYVHEAAQRGGIGGELFHHFLAAETQVPARLAYDRPSPKLLAFLAKRFHLRAHKPQNNNYVVFRDYWRVGPRPASAAKAAMKEMGGRGGLAAAARAKAAAARGGGGGAKIRRGRFGRDEEPFAEVRVDDGPVHVPARFRGTARAADAAWNRTRARVTRHGRFHRAFFCRVRQAATRRARGPRADSPTDSPTRWTRASDTCPTFDRRIERRHVVWTRRAKTRAAARECQTGKRRRRRRRPSIARRRPSIARGRRSTSSFAPRRPPRLGSPISTRRVARPVTFPSRRRRNLSTIRIVVFDLRAARRLAIRSPRNRFVVPSPNAIARGSDETELRKRVDERLREHPHGVDTGTVDSSEPGRKYAEFVRRLRAAGASSTDSRCSRRDSNARGEYGQVAYPAPGYYRARAPERPFPEAPVYHYRRSDAPWLPGGCGDASVRRRRRDVARAARTVGKSGDDEDGRLESPGRFGISPGIGNGRGETIGRGPEGYRRAENEWFTYGEGQDAYWRGRARFDAVRGSRFDPKTPRAPMVASAKRRAANAKRFESDVVRYGREVMARSKGAWDAT